MIPMNKAAITPLLPPSVTDQASLRALGVSNVQSDIFDNERNTFALSMKALTKRTDVRESLVERVLTPEEWASFLVSVGCRPVDARYVAINLWEYDEEGHVTVPAELYLLDHKGELKNLPLKIKKVKGNLPLSHTGLTSLKNLPEHIENCLWLDSEQDFDDFPPETTVEGRIYLSSHQVKLRATLESLGLPYEII